MNELLKRLEIIKKSILLEDTEIIELQLKRIATLNYESDVKNIISLIENVEYENAIKCIDDYLNKYLGIVEFEDENIKSLKLELKVLEQRLQEINTKKEEYLHLINEFNTEYNNRLGLLIEEILKIKKDILEAQLEENPSLQNEYEDSKNDYESFKKQYKELSNKKIYDISDNDMKELKKLYKEAAKLCHPDIVETNKKNEAELIFKELNDDYSSNDIEKVKDILNKLKRNLIFDFDSNKLNNAELLKNKISDLKEKIISVEVEIDNIINSETYKIVSNISDWENYFDDLRKQLLEEKKLLVEKKDLNYN
ncbi:MAG: hypothetical protein ACQERD_09225 [Campylobacterota bacterium]